MILYNIFIFIYQQAVRLAARRSTKARAWVQGRKGQMDGMAHDLAHETNPIIWIHSASTGEFEQAKPVIEALRLAYPDHKIAATFFSPSGYDAAAKYAFIHYRYYLPLDTAANAQAFITLLKPVLVIFSKYDFWHHHISAIRHAGIPLVLISSIFRRSQLFFRWYGGFYRNILQQFSHIFVQDESSLLLLQGIGIGNCSISGDTRFDRVVSIANQQEEKKYDLAEVGAFIRNRPCFVAGSTWPADESLIASAMAAYPQYCVLIVPHEIGKDHIAQLQQRFSNAFLYSELDRAFPVRPMMNTEAPLWEEYETEESKLLQERYRQANVLIVDAMGKLATLYANAQITYVGGGFNRSGIHNTLEAAVWGNPVIIGPNYHKHREARELIASGGAFCIRNAKDLQGLLQTFTEDKAALNTAAAAAENYVRRNAGATQRTMAVVKRLLEK